MTGVVEVKRQGDWMQTFSGRKFWPLDPRASEIDPADIAHALGMICRYGGHVQRFYSVAEHCVLMSHAVPERYALWALLHDATEAYVGDMIRPLKVWMPTYRDAEDRIMTAVAVRFGLPWDEDGMPACVKLADTRIMLDERAALLTDGGHEWESLAGLEPLGVDIMAWSPANAKYRYMRRLNELYTYAT